MTTRACARARPRCAPGLRRSNSQTKEQTETIQRLRAEIAAANERTARQAAHFTDELRRLGAGSYQTTASPRRGRGEPPARKSLSERITEPAPSETGTGRTGARAAEDRVSEPRLKHRASGFLRALGGGNGASAASEAAKGGEKSSPTMAQNENAAENGAVTSEAAVMPADATGPARLPANRQRRRRDVAACLERIIRADNAE